MSDSSTQRLKDVYATHHAEELLALKAFCPDYFSIISAFGLETLWQRDGLTPREKELIVLSSLISQGDMSAEIRQHYVSAGRRGVTLNDMLELVIFLTAYTGVPRTLNAINLFLELSKGTHESQ